MSEVIKVGMADLNVCKAPDVITTLGLGSCIGLVLYDPVTKVGGMVHYMLPDSTKVRNNSNIAKFGDTGIRELLKRVVAAGASKPRLIAKIAGGALLLLSDSPWYPVHLADLIQNGTADTQARICLKLYVFSGIKLINGIDKSEYSITNQIFVFHIVSKIHAEPARNHFHKRCIFRNQLFSQRRRWIFLVFSP